MPPKGKRTKAEEALDFLSNLDNLDAPPENTPAASETPRVSIDSTRKSLSSSRELPGKAGSARPQQDDEAESHLAFLEAQMQRKTKPLSDSRSGTPLSNAGSAPVAAQEAANVPSAPPPAPEPEAPVSSGWGSLWSSATSALQSAQRVADEQYQKVKAEGVSGVTVQLEHYGVNVKDIHGVDLNKLRKGAEERLGGMVKGVDLEKIRKDLLNTTTSTLTTILDTVAPPISEHETLELWLSHPMEGYAGVEGVIYRSWARILEQTDSGELIVIWSPAPTPGAGGKEGAGEGRSINPVNGWEAAWELSQKEVEGVKGREAENPEAKARVNRDVPVTVVPIFLYLQPVLVPLPFPEPPISNSSASTPDKPHTPPKHLQFLLTLQDPEHKLTFTTVTQPTPEDWMEVEYERSEWVEERLVEVIRTGVEVIAQDYVATRMGLKPSAPQAAAVAALVEQASQENAEKEKESAEQEADKKN
ncbi:hypothetical protein IAR50_005019 [Cryptococcus sp. DSM 104548]